MGDVELGIFGHEPVVAAASGGDRPASVSASPIAKLTLGFSRGRTDGPPRRHAPRTRSANKDCLG